MADILTFDPNRPRAALTADRPQGLALPAAGDGRRWIRLPIRLADLADDIETAADIRPGLLLEFEKATQRVIARRADQIEREQRAAGVEPDSYREAPRIRRTARRTARA